jgi:phage baseplate assembly protein W
VTARPLRGMAFPFRITAGRVAQAEDARKAEDDVVHLLSTRIGERLLRRNYGGGVHQYLQQSDDQAVRALLRHDLELALRTFVPELRLAGPIRLVHSEQELRVQIDYRLDAADVVRSLELALPGADRPAGGFGDIPRRSP